MAISKLLALTLFSAAVLVGCKRDRSNDWESNNQPPPPPSNQPGWGNNQPPPPPGGPGGPGGPGWNDDNWQPQRWVQVGYAQVDNRSARRVTIDNRADGRFRQVRLTVNRGSLEVYDVSIRMSNGRVYTPDIRQTFDSGTRTRVIDLPNTTRSIDQVRFMCRTMNRNERPTITVFAR